MNFWKNPEYDSARMLIVLALVAGIGFSIYRLAGDNFSMQGSALQGTKKNLGDSEAPSIYLDAHNGSSYYVLCDTDNDGSADWIAEGSATSWEDAWAWVEHYIDQCISEGGVATNGYGDKPKTIIYEKDYIDISPTAGDTIPSSKPIKNTIEN